MIKLIKWALFALCCGWAVYSIHGFWVMSQIGGSLTRFTGIPATAHSADSGLPNVLALLQAGVVAVGPAIEAAVFLVLRWPVASPNSH
jgi:hypothetical protein